MEIIRQNRLIAAILGGLVLVSALVLLLNNDSEGPRAPSAADPGATATVRSGGLPADPQADAQFPHPNIEQLECRSLLTAADIDDTFGTTAWGSLTRGESCTHTLVEDQVSFIRIEPGQPTDIIDGGSFDESTGDAVEGIGDIAYWFASESTLSVGAETDVGILVFRVTADIVALDEPARLEMARDLAAIALPRFPGIDIEPPAPPDPPEAVELPLPTAGDIAGFGYVENLLQREADGDWTRGDGLIQTLSVLVGESAPAEALRDEDLLDTGTRLVRLAQDFVDDAPTDPAATEVQRLLDQLLSGPERFVPASARSADEPRTASMAIQQTQEPAELPCQSRVCERAPADPSGFEPCSWGRWDEARQPDECWSYLIRHEIRGQEYRLFVPETAGSGGWIARYERALWDTVIETESKLNVLSIRLGNVDVYEKPAAETSPERQTFGTTSSSAGRCKLYITPRWQSMFDDNEIQAKQALSLLLAECAIEQGGTFTPLSLARLWPASAPMYLSDLMFGDGELEVRFGMPFLLQGEELAGDLRQRRVAPWAFLESLQNAQAVALLQTPSGELDGFPNIDDLLSDHAVTLTDAGVGNHPASPRHPYDAPTTAALVITEPVARFGQQSAFGGMRLELNVVEGSVACIEFNKQFDEASPTTGQITVRRPGPIGDATGAWTRELPQTLTGDNTLVVTSTTDFVVTFEVSELVSDPDDCGKQNNAPGRPVPAPLATPCNFCDPSSFFFDALAGLKAAIRGAD